VNIWILSCCREKVSDWIKLSMTLIVLCVASFVLLHFCNKHVEPVSRRFANLTYLLWMVGCLTFC